MGMFAVALLVMTKNWKQPKCPIQWNTSYYTATEMGKLQLHMSTWLNLTNNTVKKGSLR